MSAQVRLVATDLDGTIVRRDGTISPRVLDALRRVEDGGLDLVLVTGRPPRWMGPVVEMTGHRGVAICANGALVIDLETEQAVQIRPVTVEVVKSVIRDARRVLPDAAFALETTTGFVHEPSYAPRWDVGTSAVDDLLAALDDGRVCVKVLVRDESSTGDAMLAAVGQALGASAEVTHSNAADCLLEISAPGVTKATTLATLCEQRGIDASEVVAFGDQPNDLAMLAWAGRAYAVANAHPDVLAAVADHTASVDDDGVALILEQLL